MGSSKFCNVYKTSENVCLWAFPSNYSIFKDLTKSTYSVYLQSLATTTRISSSKSITKKVLDASDRFNYVGWVEAGDKWIRRYIKCEEDFLALVKDFSELSFSLEISLEILFNGKSREQGKKNYILYDTKKGFDQEFNDHLDCDLKRMLLEMNLLQPESVID